jgi:LPXTG-site transpeptidase (sortase) family protein
MKAKIGENWLPRIIKAVWIVISLAAILFLSIRPRDPGIYEKPISKISHAAQQSSPGGSLSTGSDRIVDSWESANAPAGPGAPDLQPREQAGLGRPARLIVPSINVDASVVYVGITPQGAMDVPKGPDDVAWFDLGPRPGEQGSAVIAGHEGWKDGIPAIFDNLHSVKKGDKLYILDDMGATTAFVVRRIGTYGESGDASGVFASGDGASHLNLITCEGSWNKSEKSYSDRLVVFADKEVE